MGTHRTVQVGVLAKESGATALSLLFLSAYCQDRMPIRIINATYSCELKGLHMAVNIHFTDFFGVSPDTLEQYGAFNISLVNDLPLFVDPFLLFNSSKPAYQQLHADIIRYVRFLKDMSAQPGIHRGLLKSWFYFSEIRQNWLGFSTVGNRGSGLGGDFANALNQNLYAVFMNFGEEEVTRSSHLEKLCLIKSGVGKDNISDFTTNLIKGFLLEYLTVIQ